MKNDTCDKIRPLLVDYSDRELPGDEIRQIAAHLAQCPACREELRLLEHSLALAREVWNDAATTEPLTISQTSNKPLAASRSTNKPLAASQGIDQPLAASRGLGSKRRTLRRPLAWISGAVAISAVVVLLLFGQSIFSLFKSSGDNSPSIALVKNNTPQKNSTRPNSASTGEDIDVMQYIAREERSARLAASVQLLADQPGLAQYKENAERYLKQNYADTAAVRMLEKQQSPPQ
jgi:hypothetical protein